MNDEILVLVVGDLLLVDQALKRILLILDRLFDVSAGLLGRSTPLLFAAAFW